MATLIQKSDRNGYSSHFLSGFWSDNVKTKTPCLLYFSCHPIGIFMSHKKFHNIIYVWIWSVYDILHTIKSYILSERKSVSLVWSGLQKYIYWGIAKAKVSSLKREGVNYSYRVAQMMRIFVFAFARCERSLTAGYCLWFPSVASGLQPAAFGNHPCSGPLSAPLPKPATQNTTKSSIFHPSVANSPSGKMNIQILFSLCRGHPVYVCGIQR